MLELVENLLKEMTAQVCSVFSDLYSLTISASIRSNSSHTKTWNLVSVTESVVRFLGLTHNENVSEFSPADLDVELEKYFDLSADWVKVMLRGIQANHRPRVSRVLLANLLGMIHFHAIHRSLWIKWGTDQISWLVSDSQKKERTEDTYFVAWEVPRLLPVRLRNLTRWWWTRFPVPRIPATVEACSQARRWACLSTVVVEYLEEHFGCYSLDQSQSSQKRCHHTVKCRYNEHVRASEIGFL